MTATCIARSALWAPQGMLMGNYEWSCQADGLSETCVAMGHAAFYQAGATGQSWNMGQSGGGGSLH